MIPCLISSSTVTVIFKAKPFSLPIEDDRAKPLAEAAEANDAAKVEEIINAHQKALAEALALNVTELAGITVEIRYGHVYINGQLDDGSAARRILHLHKIGLPHKHLMNFLARLRKNPSKNSVDQLYGFLEANKLPITPDGYVIAFKAVRDDFLDIYSGTIDNSVGRTVAVERYQVDDDFNRTCSHGLHVCGESYLPNFGVDRPSRVVLVKIDPADFVAVPRDYNNAKARVCRYEVIDEMSREGAAKYFETRSRVTFDRQGIVEEAELETEEEDFDETLESDLEDDYKAEDEEEDFDPTNWKPA